MIHLILLLLLVCVWISFVYSDDIRICPGDDLNINCSPGELIVASSAFYGRMEFNDCLMANDLIGCKNNVLFLIDKWCSGRISCVQKCPNRDLEMANKACLPYLKMYLQVNYACMKVITSYPECTIPDADEGTISSHMTSETGCGSASSPWIITTRKGRTVKFSIIDFGSESFKTRNVTADFPLYGYIRDNSERSPFFGSPERDRPLYQSKSNKVTIEVALGEDNLGFMLHFKKIGCPDLTPPAHAWYKRDGDQAVIGCEWSQKTWHLSCDGHSWSGVVGNCSEPVTQEPLKTKKEFSNPPALWLVCMISVSVVTVVIACVTGIVCIKKYRIKNDIQKSMTLQRIPGQGHYDLDPNIEMASMLYLPYKTSDQQQQQQQGAPTDPSERPTSYLVPQDQIVNELTPIRIWERPLPELPDKPLATDTVCATTTPTAKAGRTPGDGDEAVSNCSVQESGILQSYQTDISTNRSQTAHKYSPLGTANL